MNEFAAENIKEESHLGNEFAPMEWKIEEIIKLELNNAYEKIMLKVNKEIKHMEKFENEF